MTLAKRSRPSIETSIGLCKHEDGCLVSLDTPVAMCHCLVCGEVVSVVYLLQSMQREIDRLKALVNDD